MKVFHFSDLHIRGYQRHEEYKNILNNFLSLIDKENPDIVYFGGDFWHTKCSNITPEAIELMAWLIKEISKRKPFYMLLGNHDGALSNEKRQDAITPIVNAIDNKNVFLLKKSGVYDIEGFENFNFCAYSPFDKDGWGAINPQKNKINIALFHGSIQGSKMDNEWRMPHGEEMLSFFDGHDFGFLGDIHKNQYLAYRNNKPYIAYPGSLIQQNYGEDEEKGFLIWDIKNDGSDWDIKFVKLENQTPFISVPWDGSIESTLKLIEETRGTLNKGTRVRLCSNEQLNPYEVRRLNHELKEKNGCGELVFKIDLKREMLDSIANGNTLIHKTSLRHDYNAVINLYKNYINNQLSNLKLSERQIDEGSELIKGYLSKFNESENDSINRDIQWSIRELQFSNFFRYGENNIIDFNKLEGIIGLFGNNAVGKSSVVSTLMYALFNRTDRESVKVSEIVNRNKKNAHCKLKINIAGIDYIIEREVIIKETKKQEEKISSTLQFKRIEKDGTVSELINENGDTKSDTDKAIRKLIGTQQDFSLTSLSSQYSPNNFISQGPTQRKAILNKFLDLDIFDKLYKFVNDDVNILNSKTINYKAENLIELIENSKKKLEQFENDIKNNEELYALKTNDLNKLNDYIKEHQSVLVYKEQYETINQEFNSLQHTCNLLETEISDFKFQIERLSKQKNDLSNQLSMFNIEELKNNLIELHKIEKEYNSVKSDLRTEDLKLNNQIKSVKKLDIVPCGDSYSSCHYIKDSYEDKKNLETQKKYVEKLTDTSNKLNESLSKLLTIEASRKIKQAELIQQELNNLEIKLIKYEEKLKSNTEILPLKLAEKEILEKRLESIYSLLNKDIDKVQLQIKNLNMEIKSLSKEKNDLYMNLGSTKEKIEAYIKQRKESEEILAKLKIYHSVLDAFSKNGIPALVLKNQLPLINNELEKITLGLNFKLTLETDLNSNTLDVYIENNQPKRIIELCSGAEMAMASLAIRVALCSISSLPKCDLLIVDEGFSSLDEDNVPRVLQLLSLFKKYFKTILIISHLPQIKEAAERILDISNNGIESNIRFF